MHETLKPFLKEAAKASMSTSEKLVFHMAVMRWKCSLLTLDERTTLDKWIDEQRTSKEKARTLPWSEEAGEHGDELFAENVYVQRCVIQTFLLRTDTDPVFHSTIDSLAVTVQTAMEEIERQTGWKAMVILGGLEPRTGGISSHL